MKQMKLPAFVWSALGPVPVKLVKDLKVSDSPTEEQEAFGTWDENRRAISIEPTACAPTQIKTLFHEMTHVALNDAGVNNTFNEAAIETVCDVLGSYLAGAAIAGYITIKVPKA